MTTRSATFALLALPALAAVAALLFASCEEDLLVCDPPCPASLVCATGDDGLPACLPPCGNTVCTGGQTCVNNVCTGGGTVTCPTGEHAVANVCVPNYTTSNVCDPWRFCRADCGTSASCLQACEADRSASCEQCATSLASCESRSNCRSGAYVEDCCFDEFCDCYPGHPNCGNVPPCDECDDECGNNTACLNACIQGEPACANCLQPFFDCRDSGGSNCEALAADCSSN